VSLHQAPTQELIRMRAVQDSTATVIKGQGLGEKEKRVQDMSSPPDNMAPMGYLDIHTENTKDRDQAQVPPPETTPMILSKTTLDHGASSSSQSWSNHPHPPILTPVLMV